jgi:hypothetical protein
MKETREHPGAFLSDYAVNQIDRALRTIKRQGVYGGFRNTKFLVNKIARLMELSAITGRKNAKLIVMRVADRPGKSLLSEQEVVTHFVSLVLEETKRKWPSIYESYKSHLHDGSFAVRDEIRAPYDLCFATIALNLESIQNLYPSEQANRIESKLLKYLSQIVGWGSYAANEVRRYTELFRSELLEMGQGHYPIGAIAYRLHRQWFGAVYEDMDKQTKVALMTIAMTFLPEFVELWTSVNADFQIVEGESEFNLSAVRSHVAKGETSPRVFVVSSDKAVLEHYPKLLRTRGCEAAGSMSLINCEWAPEEVLADAIAFQPDVLMFSICCHLCPEVNGSDIPTMLFRQFPNSRIVATKIGSLLHVSELGRKTFEEECRFFHVIDLLFEIDELLAVMWFDREWTL